MNQEIKSKAEKYFEQQLYYEDKENEFHPDQVDKLQDIDKIKVYYKAMFDMLDFHRKNLAANYLNLTKQKSN